MLNKIKSSFQTTLLYHLKARFFLNFFATGPASPRSTTPPLQHVLEKPAFSWVTALLAPLLHGEICRTFLYWCLRPPSWWRASALSGSAVHSSPFKSAPLHSPRPQSGVQRAPVASSGNFGSKAGRQYPITVKLVLSLFCNWLWTWRLLASLCWKASIIDQKKKLKRLWFNSGYSNWGLSMKLRI